MDGACITDAGDEKNGVGQEGECESSENENFRVECVPSPASGLNDQESESGGSQCDDSGGSDSVAAGESLVGVQEKKQEGDGIFNHHHDGYKSAVARIDVAEKACCGKEDRRDKRVRECGDAQCDKENVGGDGYWQGSALGWLRC